MAYIFATAQCTTVNEDGSVTISFGNISNATIERQDNGNWVEIGNLHNGTYTDEDVDASNDIIIYRIPTSSQKQLFATVNCKAEVKSDDNTKIEIIWHTVYVGSSIPTDLVGYKVYRKLSTDDDFKYLVEVVPNENTYIDDKQGVCAVQYKVEAIFLDCSSWSNVAKTIKEDNDPPDQVTLLPVDVDLNSQQIVLSWKESMDADTWGYALLKVNDSGIKETIQMIYDKSITSYTCTKQQADVNQINNFKIFAFDYCENSSMQFPELNDEYYNNIVLKGERDDCSAPLHLSWNAPDNVNQGHQYEIFARLPGESQYNSVAIVSSNSYDYTVPVVQGDIQLYVECGGKSNVVTINTQNADTLKYIYLEGVSVKEDNLHTDIYIFLDASQKVKGYQLWRKIDDGEFENIKDIAFSGQSYIVVTDELPLMANEHIYTYYVAAPDACGGNYTYSNQMTTMQLSVDASNTSKIKLTWNPIKPANWNVASYEIYRFAEGDFANAQYIGKTVSNSYTDNAEQMVSATDRTYYYVKATSNNTANTDIRANGVNSSNAYAKFESILFVPNAFSPKDGLHAGLRTFKPTCHFVRSGTYSFKVFSRAGQVLFETNNTDEGWDGKYKGEFCPVGNYVYKISFIDSDGIEQNKGGIFLLYD